MIPPTTKPGIESFEGQDPRLCQHSEQRMRFLVRTGETWDFGDGSPQVTVQSDGNVVPLAKDGYARTVHRFAKAGQYVVRVERTDGRGFTAVGHVQVLVEGN